MRSKELGVTSHSDYYLYTPSQQALRAFLYPICVGRFYYAPGYSLERNSFDSVLIMLVTKGVCHIEIGGSAMTATTGQIVLIDCYQPHKYYTDTGWDALWVHFDGIAAMEYYKMGTASFGNVITLKDNYTFEKYMTRIYEIFHTGSPVKEPLVSKYLINILSELLLNTIEVPSSHLQSGLEDTIAYINEHLNENLTLEALAKHTSLSPYYFTRVFKKETGYTPHEYIILSRMNSAKFLLKNTSLSIKEIAFCTGSTSESSFCTAFKQREGMTPSAYRSSDGSPC